jgi:nitroreductase
VPYHEEKFLELSLTPRELLTTTRTVRKRLDLTRPVPRDVVEECLRIGWQAPNGGNMQQYQWVLVDDQATRAAMGKIYAQCMADVFEQAKRAQGGAPGPVPKDRAAQVMDSTAYLVEHIGEVPVLVVPTIAGRVDTLATLVQQAQAWGSILPAVWNFMLALRSQAMGSAWTTIHLMREQEMADLLGIPYDDVTQVGMFPVAYTVGTEFRPASRALSEETIHWNSW